MSIRRSSDNAFKDFYPDSNGRLSMSSEDGLGTSLSTWIGSDSGYIYIWYDQTGNGNHWVNVVLLAQVPIISSGVLLTDVNGLAAPSLSGTTYFDSAGFSGHTVCDSDMVFSTSSTTFMTYGFAGATYSFVAQSGSASAALNGNYGSPTLYVDGVAPTQNNRNDIYLASIGTSKVITHQGANTTTFINSGVNKYNGFRMNGKFQFNASFSSDQSSTLAARVAYLQSKFQ